MELLKKNFAELSLLNSLLDDEHPSDRIHQMMTDCVTTCSDTKSDKLTYDALDRILAVVSRHEKEGTIGELCEWAEWAFEEHLYGSLSR
jgi:hypothetical protein